MSADNNATERMPAFDDARERKLAASIAGSAISQRTSFDILRSIYGLRAKIIMDWLEKFPYTNPKAVVQRLKNKYIDAADEMIHTIIAEITGVTSNLESVYQQSYDSFNDLRSQLYPMDVHVSESQKFDFVSIEQDCIKKISASVVSRENQRNTTHLITSPPPMPSSQVK